MSYTVYVLFSPLHKRTYVGQTQDVTSRLTRHNAGKVRSTKAYRPWLIFHQECFQLRAEAMKREEWFKGSTGRKHIAQLLAAETSSLSATNRYSDKARSRHDSVVTD